MFEVGKSYRLSGNNYGFILRCDFVGKDKSLFTNISYNKDQGFDRELVVTNSMFDHYEEVKEPESLRLKIAVLRNRVNSRLGYSVWNHSCDDKTIRNYYYCPMNSCTQEVIDIVPFTYTEKEK